MIDKISFFMFANYCFPRKTVYKNILYTVVNFSNVTVSHIPHVPNL